MNWEAIGAIGEVVGAIGVIVTLGYLAVQIRQNTASVRASTLQTMSEASTSFHVVMARDAELSRIFHAGVLDPEALSPEEYVRFRFAMMAFLRRVEGFHGQAGRNRVAPEEWAGLRESCLSVMSQPGARAWWAEESGRYNPDFAAWLDQELGRRPASNGVQA